MTWKISSKCRRFIMRDLVTNEMKEVVGHKFTEFEKLPPGVRKEGDHQLIVLATEPGMESMFDDIVEPPHKDEDPKPKKRSKHKE